MGSVGIQVKDSHEVDSLEAALYSENEVKGGVCYTSQLQKEIQQSETMALDDANLSVIQTKLFKRRRRAIAVLEGDPERGLPRKCCGRCKSDLNGKLMVRCSTCSFRCHLYCFSPPLKQHPAFLIRRQEKTRQQDATNFSSIWKCQQCEGTSVVFNVSKPRPSSSAVGSSNKTSLENTPQKRESDSNTSAVTAMTGGKVDKESGWRQTVQPQWIENAEVVFDWYRFRSEKAEALRSHETDPKHNRNGVDDLVFYSKTYALIKKTAAIWRAHVIRQRRFRHQQELETECLRFPDKSVNVMHEGQPLDKSTVTVIHEEDLDEEDGNLVDINQYIPYLRRRPHLPLLWEGEPPSALMCWTTEEREKIANILEEIEDRMCLANEDVDAPSPPTRITAEYSAEADVEHADGAAGLNAENHDFLKVYASATIIQTIFARHRRRRRRVERASRQHRTLEEAQCRAKTRSSIALLRTCIQFIVVLMKMLGQARTKKAMLLLLRDAAEETRVTKDDSMLEGEKESRLLDRQQKRQLSEMRIRRFFMRRVHPYVKLKKNVMARRVQRWWKRKHYRHKWREVAIAVRLGHRNQACIRVQRFYRHFWARSQFHALLEKHALKKLRRALRGWLFSRLAKKEAKRCDVYEAAQLTMTEDNPLREYATIDEILEKRGLNLYEQGDFWNAAAILERLCQMKQGNLALKLQQVLAYSHHMAWYTSYDRFNLTRAHELYCSALEKTNRPARVDPLVLQDLAIVMMHLEHFGDSLRLLAKLIEYYAHQPQFSLWLLLAAVQLQQRGEWEQSVGYLTYLHDIPPPPYLECEILALAAMSYEHWALAAAEMSDARASNATLAKEAWRAALRHWNLEKMRDERSGSVSTRGNGRALTSKQKCELLATLGLRAVEQGHYLLACRVYLYALERVESNDQDKQETWRNLAEVFRHLGHLDLYLNAVLRSQSDSLVDDEAQKHWRRPAEQQACSFQTELKALTVLQKLLQLNGNAT